MWPPLAYTALLFKLDKGAPLRTDGLGNDAPLS